MFQVDPQHHLGAALVIKSSFVAETPPIIDGEEWSISYLRWIHALG